MQDFSSFNLPIEVTVELTTQDELIRKQAEEIKTINEYWQSIVESSKQRIEQLNQDLDKSRSNHRGDISKIGTRILQEADDRDWCDEFDDIISDLNENLTVPLQRRTRTYKVSFFVRSEVSLSGTVEITAANADQAGRLLDENPYDYIGDLDDYIRDDIYNVEFLDASLEVNEVE